jgi:hypothetical protein
MTSRRQARTRPRAVAKLRHTPRVRESDSTAERYPRGERVHGPFPKLLRGVRFAAFDTTPGGDMSRFKREAEYDSTGAGHGAPPEPTWEDQPLGQNYQDTGNRVGLPKEPTWNEVHETWDNAHNTQNQGPGWGAYGQQYQAQRDAGPTAYPNGGATGAEPPKRRKHGKVFWAVLAIVLGTVAAVITAIVVVAVAAGPVAVTGSGVHPSSAAVPGGSGAAPAPKSGDGTQHFAMGETATATTFDGKDALDITLNRPRVNHGGEFERPQGDHYLAVTATVKALLPGQSINPYDFNAVGDDGATYNVTFISQVQPPMLDAKDLNDGQTLKGSLVFDVPKGAKIAGIEYAPGYSQLGVWDVKS